MATKDAKEKMGDGLGQRKGGMYLDPWVDGFSLFVEYFTTPVHQISTLSGKCKFREKPFPSSIENKILLGAETSGIAVPWQ